MIGYLIVLFLLLPFIDIYLLLELSGRIGFLNTVGIIVLTGLAGAAIVRREGVHVLMKLQRSVTAQEVSRNLLEGGLVVFAGLLLLSPGLVTDFLGALFVWKKTRLRIALWIEKKLKGNAQVQVQTFEF